MFKQFICFPIQGEQTFALFFSCLGRGHTVADHFEKSHCLSSSGKTGHSAGVQTVYLLSIMDSSKVGGAMVL